MAEVVIFHHAHGVTPGLRKIAESLRAQGHQVHLPDLFEGHSFEKLEDGIAYFQQLGFQNFLDRATSMTARVTGKTVWVGLSLGVICAQKLAQTMPNTKGALLLHACLPRSEFSEAWPPGIPVQIHAMEADPFFVNDGDIDCARALCAETKQAELFLYPGSKHLFTDSSLADFDPVSAGLALERITAFLARSL